jgi:phosphoribosylamine--glycine ligase
MRILIVGAGAREHAIAWSCRRSPLCDELVVAPGNGGTAAIARNVAVPADDVGRLTRLATEERMDLVVLGPEAAVAAGVGDSIREAGIPVFGPNRGPGRIESSKAFAKELMREAGIPTAAHAVFNGEADADAARRWAAERGGRVAVKADGLALGKGVVVCGAMDDAEAAIQSMLVRRTFGLAGASVVLEERLEGPELSLIGISDGRDVVALAAARDYKRALEGDRGPNTGGMGAYSPPAGVREELVEELRRTVLLPCVRTLASWGLEYRGVLYAGLMLTPDGPRVLEFNARFGDPEAQVILPRLESDLVELMLAAAQGRLVGLPPLAWNSRPAVGVVVASGGYPDAYETGFAIQGLDQVPPGVLVFHAGTRASRSSGLVTSGGRVLTTVGLGETVEQARLASLAGAVRVRFSGAHFRGDIARE